MGIDKCVNKKIFDNVFLDHSIKIRVFLRASKVKGDNFDPFRQTQFDETSQNPLFVDAITKSVSPNELLLKSFGLTEAGALQIIIKENDLSLIKLSQKIIIDNEEYYVRNDAVGGKLQVFDRPFGYKRIIIFKKDV